MKKQILITGLLIAGCAFSTANAQTTDNTNKKETETKPVVEQGTTVELPPQEMKIVSPEAQPNGSPKKVKQKKAVIPKPDPMLHKEIQGSDPEKK